MSDPTTPAEWAARLEREWEERARSEDRDFFIMAHPGWSRPESWEHQAAVDVQSLLLGLPPERTAGWDVLEVGCGVGRLAAPILERVRSSTGYDAAPGMVAEARRRCAALSRARFFTGGADGPPAPVCEQRYHLILAHAVLIHSPKVLIASILGRCAALLREEGQLRGQLYADPT